MTYTADEAKLKRLLKAAVVEVLEERRDLVQEAFAEVMLYQRPRQKLGFVIF